MQIKFDQAKDVESLGQSGSISILKFKDLGQFYKNIDTVGSQLIACELIALFLLCDKLGCAISWDVRSV